MQKEMKVLEMEGYSQGFGNCNGKEEDDQVSNED